MSYLRLIIIFALAGLLQPTIVNVLSINGMTVSLPLCFGTVITYIYQKEERAVTASAAAFLSVDILVSQIIGIQALSGVAALCTVLLYKRFVNPENKLSILPLMILSTVVFNMSMWIILGWFGNIMDIGTVFSCLWTTICLNTIFAFILYLLMNARAIRINRENRSEENKKNIEY